MAEVKGEKNKSKNTKLLNAPELWILFISFPIWDIFPADGYMLSIFKGTNI